MRQIVKEERLCWSGDAYVGAIILESVAGSVLTAMIAVGSCGLPTGVNRLLLFENHDRLAVRIEGLGHKGLRVQRHNREQHACGTGVDQVGGQ